MDPIITLKEPLTIRSLIDFAKENNLSFDTRIMFEDMSDGGYSPWLPDYIKINSDGYITLCVD